MQGGKPSRHHRPRLPARVFLHYKLTASQSSFNLFCPVLLLDNCTHSQKTGRKDLFWDHSVSQKGVKYKQHQRPAEVKGHALPSNGKSCPSQFPPSCSGIPPAKRL